MINNIFYTSGHCRLVLPKLPSQGTKSYVWFLDSPCWTLQYNVSLISTHVTRVEVPRSVGALDHAQSSRDWIVKYQ